jgi:hypothetical protein
MRLSFFLFAILFPYHIFSQAEKKTSPFILDTVNNRKVYLVVDTPPKTSIEFNRLPFYITENNFWPTMDTSCYLSKVLLSFIIEPNGSVSNANVEIRGGLCDNPVRNFNNKAFMRESLKESLSKLRWTPGVIKGQKVPVLMTIPVNVHLYFD